MEWKLSWTLSRAKNPETKPKQKTDYFDNKNNRDKNPYSEIDSKCSWNFAEVGVVHNSTRFVM